MSERPLHIVIAGGGTGGHLFPGVAVAQEFAARRPGSRILFVSTGTEFERKVLDRANFQLSPITVEGLKKRGILNQIRAVVKLPVSVWESWRILSAFKPDLVLSVGSYAAGPVGLSAWLMGIPLVLHEQNILPGITNRILSRFARRIYVSFPDSRTHFDPEKTRVSGNPIRREFIDMVSAPSDRSVAQDNRPFTVLILGGSQGAHSINMAVKDALPHLGQLQRFAFIHQTGHRDEAEVKEAYESARITGTVKSFFNDMADRYAAADLIVCRAGATTVAEVTVLGKPVIFIPFPYAADDHQALNARNLQQAGAADMILEKDLSGSVLAEKISGYAASPERLDRMAGRSREFGRPDAARIIVEDCCRLINAQHREVNSAIPHNME